VPEPRAYPELRAGLDQVLGITEILYEPSRKHLNSLDFLGSSTDRTPRDEIDDIPGAEVDISRAGHASRKRVNLLTKRIFPQMG
jgi:hypothetical protein